METAASGFKGVMRYLRESGLYLPLMLWVVLYAWHPFALGFYYDDWGTMPEARFHGAAFSLDRLTWFYHFIPDRPLQGFNYFFLTSLFEDSAFLWQSWMALTFLAFMIVYFHFLTSLFKLFDLKPGWAIPLATALWPCLPWILGWSVWCCTNGFWIMLLFVLTCERLITPWVEGKNPGLLPAVLNTVASLMYEQFYFQFFLILGFLFVSGKARELKKRLWLLPVSALFVGQVATFLYNRSLSHRGLMSNGLSLFINKTLTLPLILLRSGGSLKAPLAISAVIVVPVLLWAFYQQVAKAPSRQKRWAWLGLLGISLTGLLMCAAYYSVGGYPLGAVGTGSRTVVGLSFWLVTLFAIGFYSWFNLSKSPRVAWLSKIAIAALFVSLALASLQKTSEWATVWAFENKVLASAPVRQIMQTRPDAVILYEGPYKYKNILFFNSEWSVTGAMNGTYPQIRPLQNPQGDTFQQRGWKPFLLCAKYPVVWDGERIKHKIGGRMWSGYASEVWLWEYKTNRLLQLQAPLTIKCERNSLE